MKNYHVYFSYYSEEYGQFEDRSYCVYAENQFEARRKAWEYCESDDDMKFASCIKQCGVMWDSSPTNLQDYFNAEAAASKCRAKIIENAEIPNADIQNNEEKKIELKNEISYYWGSIKTVSDIAKDMGKPFGLQPPDLFDELHYAEAFVNKIENSGDYSRAFTMLNKIEAAKKWDENAMFSLSDFFRNSYITLDGESFYFGQDFNKDGIFPEKANVTDYASKYISRWQNARHIEQLTRLRMFGEKDVIPGSESWRLDNQMAYEYRILIIKPEVLPKELRKPENMLWTTVVDDDYVRYAQNVITGDSLNLSRSDFIGVIRPEFEKNIDFESLKKEYAIHKEHQSAEDSPFRNNELEEENELECC